jgi:hypothetical protein
MDYTATADAGETPADEEKMLDITKRVLNRLVDGVEREAEAEGLQVSVTRARG